jgi:aminoglycoside phosphotransferase (APT) family kinase protein
MVDAGDPVQDLAWFLLLDRHHSESVGVPRLAGFPAQDETVRRWEVLTGRPARALDWWLALGATRYAVIMTRVMELVEDTGLFPGARQMAFENTATKLLDAVLADVGG